MSLPSKYAPEGLSLEDQQKTLTVGQKRQRRPVDYTIKVIEDRIDNAVKESLAGNDDDYEMVPMDDFKEVDIISNFVNYSRKYMSYNDFEIAEFSTDLEINNTNISYLMIDTNFILSHLNIVDDLKSIAREFGLIIIIPITVMHELDELKVSKRDNLPTESGISGKSVSHLARWANDWIYRSLADKSLLVKGQKLDERIDRTASKDNAILDCCLYFQKNHPNTLQVLLSNDKNLCLKALSNDLLTVSYRKEMNAKLIAEMIYKENLDRFGELRNTQSLQPSKVITSTEEVPPEVIRTVYIEIQTIVLSVIHHCMEEAYGEALEVLKDYNKEAIITLEDCSAVMIRFWFTVFSIFFENGFKPFDEPSKGKKEPLWVDIPNDKIELTNFINFWCKILTILYGETMNEHQNNALKALISRWQQVIL